ncbi:peptidase S1 domain-containing protein [Pseudoscourfieldia marina]
MVVVQRVARDVFAIAYVPKFVVGDCSTSLINVALEGNMVKVFDMQMGFVEGMEEWRARPESADTIEIYTDEFPLKEPCHPQEYDGDLGLNGDSSVVRVGSGLFPVSASAQLGALANVTLSQAGSDEPVSINVTYDDTSSFRGAMGAFKRRSVVQNVKTFFG